MTVSPRNTPQGLASPSRRSYLSAELRSSLPLLIIVVVTIAVVGVLEPRFLAPSNVNNLLRNSLIFATVAAGQMLVMISGGFDLSVGATAALASVLSALAMVFLGGMGWESEAGLTLAGVATGLGAGAIIGLANGLAVATFHAPALIVTLGMLSAASGAAFYLTAGTPIYGMPDLFARVIPTAQFGGFSLIAICCALVLVMVWALQNLFAYGAHLQAVGGKQHAARIAGVNTYRTLVMAYVLSGLLAAFVGLLLTARLGSGQPTIGLDLMLPSIAVCVIGGVALGGGSGRVERVILAAIFLSVITNAMNLLRFDSRYQTMITGAIIIVASVLEHAWSARKSR